MFRALNRIGRRWLWGTLAGAQMFGPISNADSFSIAWDAPGVFLGIHTAQFSRDGSELITGSSTGIKAWDGRSFRLLRTISTPRYGDNLIALSPDNRWIASAYSVNFGGQIEVFLRDRRSGEIARRFAVGLQILYAMTFAGNGSWLCFSGDDFVEVREVESGALVHRLDETTWNTPFAPVFAMAPTPQGDLILAGSEEVVRVVLDRAKPEIQWRQDAAAFPISAPMNAPFVAARLGNHFGLLNPFDGAVQKTFFSATTPPDALALSDSGSQLAAVWNRGRMQVRNTASNSNSPPALDLPGLENAVSTLLWSPNSRFVVAGNSWGGSIWDLQNPGPARDIAPLPSVARGLDLSTNGWIAVSTGSGHTVILEESTGAAVARHKPNFVGGPIAMFPDGSRYVTRGSNQPVQIFDRETGVALGDIELPSGFNAVSIGISPDSRRIAILSAATDLVLSSAETRRPIHTEKLGAGRFWRELLFDSSGEILAASNSDDQILLLAANDGRLLQTLAAPDARPAYLHFITGAGRLRALSPLGQVMEWNLATGVASRLGRLDIRSPAGAFWMPDGETLIVSEPGNGLSWWSLHDGRMLSRDASPSVGWWMRDLRASRDGQFLIGARLDGVVLALDAPLRIHRFKRSRDDWSLDVAGMNPPFQLERSPAHRLDWQPWGNPIGYSTSSIPDEHGAWLFRVRKAKP